MPLNPDGCCLVCMMTINYFWLALLMCCRYRLISVVTNDLIFSVAQS
ncbi:hypothetical protein sync_1072 [Synechococcus sp. CC9311]|nr:hypothetical protein sync_1072 [Synechococcus sp. CC9311]